MTHGAVTISSDPERLFPGNYASEYVTQMMKSTSIMITISRIDAEGNIVGQPIKPNITVSGLTAGGSAVDLSLWHPTALKPYDLTLLAISGGGPVLSFAFVTNKETLLYSITFSNGSPTERHDLFPKFQNQVRMRYASKPGSVDVHAFNQERNKWCSGIDYDSTFWTAAKVKEALHTASIDTDFGDATISLKFGH